jgi:hypothetical protein
MLRIETSGNLGISRDDCVVVYDTAGIFSSCRVYWTFKVQIVLRAAESKDNSHGPNPQAARDREYGVVCA